MSTSGNTNNVWDAFEAPGGDYPDRRFKFDNVGDNIVGTITNIRKATFETGTVPELWLDTADGETSVLCGQANLMAQLIDLRPGVGDRIAIVFTGTRKAKLGTAKIFDVRLVRADGTTAEPTTEAETPTPATSAADLL